MFQALFLIKAVIVACIDRLKFLTLSTDSYSYPRVLLQQGLSLASPLVVSDLLPLSPPFHWVSCRAKSSLHPANSVPPFSSSILGDCNFHVCCYAYAAFNCRSRLLCCNWADLQQSLWGALAEAVRSAWPASRGSRRKPVTARAQAWLLPHLSAWFSSVQISVSF